MGTDDMGSRAWQKPKPLDSDQPMLTLSAKTQCFNQKHARVR